MARQSLGTEKIKRLHLCCGRNILPGWINVDALDFGGNIVFDLNKKWAFAQDESIDYIYIKDGLEHLDSVENFLQECARVLKNGGIVEIGVPHYKAPSAYKMTHKHYFSWSYWADYPEPHDKVKNLKVVSNELVFEPSVFPFTLINPIANIFPRFWEKFFYVCAINVKLQKL